VDRRNWAAIEGLTCRVMKSHEIVEWNCENLWNQKKQNARGLLPRAALAHVAMLGLEEEKADEMCRDDPQWGNQTHSEEITWNHMTRHTS
jgi:hypothetical protein